MTRISRFLSLVLRHKPDVASLKLDGEGWAAVEDVLAAVSKRFGPFDRAALERLVQVDDKQRFAFDPSGTTIRASQGHSIPVELGLEPVQPPPLLFHGTAAGALASILTDGLLKARRHHVHLSADLESARKVAGRRRGATAILEVRSGDMAAAGHLFYRSAIGVWLTDQVPPTFIRVLD